jgi:hypothetical protein
LKNFCGNRYLKYIWFCPCKSPIVIILTFPCTQKSQISGTEVCYCFNTVSWANGGLAKLWLKLKLIYMYIVTSTQKSWISGTWDVICIRQMFIKELFFMNVWSNLFSERNVGQNFFLKCKKNVRVWRIGLALDWYLNENSFWKQINCFLEYIFECL